MEKQLDNKNSNFETILQNLRKLFKADDALSYLGKKKIEIGQIGNKNKESETNLKFQQNYGGIYTNKSNNTQNALQNVNRKIRYRDYEAMDEDSIVASALDIYSEESTLKSDDDLVLTIKSDNNKIKEELDKLFFNTLNFEFNAFPWVRNLCKYGDFFLVLEISENDGITDIFPFSVYELERDEIPITDGERKGKNKVVFRLDGQHNFINKTLDNYEVIHFRLLSDTNYLPYGKSVIESGRRTWKQLKLMEDAMMVYRIMRAPERRIFYVNVGNLPVKDIDAWMEKFATRIKKEPIIDNQTGELDLKYNVQNTLEDFFFPVRGDEKATRVDTLPGGANMDRIEDINYLLNKLFTSFKIPKSFLQYEDDMSGKCIALDTNIPLLSGETKTLNELIEDYNNNIENWVYSKDENNNIVPGKIQWAGKTRLNAEVLKITLDNNKELIVTPDHNFYDRDGNLIEAQNLIEGQSLMPLYINDNNEIKIIKVLKIEKLNERIDTGDLTIEKYHNFGTDAGIIIHNSNLALEDIRFARSVERIQRTIEAELRKIAIIHLYTKNMLKEDSAVDFEILLTHSSTIQEQQEIELLETKLNVMSSAKNDKLLPMAFLLKKLFHFSDEEITQLRIESMKDAKWNWIYEQLQEEGNNPLDSDEDIDDENIRNTDNDTKGEDNEDDEERKPVNNIPDKGKFKLDLGLDDLKKQGTEYKSSRVLGNKIKVNADNELGIIIRNIKNKPLNENKIIHKNNLVKP